MDVAVIIRPTRNNQPRDLKFTNEGWNQHHGHAGAFDFQVLWSRHAIVGVSCGWTKWRDGWAIWTAENTIFLELRRKLSMSATATDAEVMQAALNRWGLDARDQTYSMWAGAVWQESRADLCFFRDRIGLTPAFYCQDMLTQTQIFSTSMSLIQAHCPEAKKINQDRLHAFLLCQNDTGRDDFFETVSRLHPGESWHLSTRESNAISNPPQIRRYWQPGVEKSDISNRRDAAQFLLEKLQNISADYLAAGYDPIICVSGGLDSTLMLSIQIEQTRKMDADPARIAAVTMGFPSFPSVDETFWTDQLQDYLGHPIAAINMEDCWPMQDPSFYTEQPELGPDFHPGSNYESVFVGRAIEKYGPRSIFWGIGADHLFNISGNTVLATLLDPQKFVQIDTLRKARHLFGMQRVGRYLAGRMPLAKPLRSIRVRVHHKKKSEQTPWRTPMSWVKPLTESMPAQNSVSIDNPRAAFLLGWDWELVIRSLRRKANRWRSYSHTPYLRADFVSATVALDVELFYKEGSPKGLQREMTVDYLPQSIRNRPKDGLFSKNVEFGLGSCEYNEIARMFAAVPATKVGNLINVRSFLKILAQYRSFCWANQSKRRAAGEVFMWQTIAAFLWAQEAE